MYVRDCRFKYYCRYESTCTLRYPLVSFFLVGVESFSCVASEKLEGEQRIVDFYDFSICSTTFTDRVFIAFR